MDINITSRLLDKVIADIKLYYFGEPNHQEIIIGDVAIYFKVVTSEWQCSIYLSLTDTKKDPNNTLYICEISSKILSINKQNYICDDSEWRLIYECTNIDESSPNFRFDLTIGVIKKVISNPFSDLYSDDVLTDFTINTEDGSVKFHSIVLAVASPVLKRMLMGQWSETQARSVTLKDVKKSTVQHLKDFLYMDILPNNSVDDLLSLASYYMIEDLENKCIKSIMEGVTLDNSPVLVKFALDKNLSKLYTAFLKHVQDGGLQGDLKTKTDSEDRDM